MSSEGPTVYVSDMMGYGLTPDNWASPETWAKVDGVFSIELHRMSNAQSSWVQIKVARSTQPAEYQQRLLIARTQITVGGVTTTDPVAIAQFNVDFVGRVDDITPIHDEQYGQSWLIRCRDYMAVLQDNYIQPEGRSRYIRSITSGADQAARWEPDWANGAGGQPPVSPAQPNPDNKLDGLVHLSLPYWRAYLAAELAMNFVDLPAGIRFVNIMQVPHATVSGGAPIPQPIPLRSLDPPFKSLKHLTDHTILDAIRDLLADDPWVVTGSQPIGSVSYDSPSSASLGGVTVEDIVTADGINNIPGLGDEIIAEYNPPMGQIVMGTSSAGGPTSVYAAKTLGYAGPYLRIFARGVLNFDPTMQFWYGSSGRYDNTTLPLIGPGTVLRYPIMSYRFPKEGGSLFTRGKVVGQGENAQDNTRWPKTFLKTAGINGGGAGAGSFVAVAPDYAGGAGGTIMDNDDEVQWRPIAALALLPPGTPPHYATVRTGIANDEGLPGYSKVSGATNPDGTSVANAGDRNTANLLRALRMMTSPSALKNLIRGNITVPGLPRNSTGHPLITGVVIGVAIPPLFVNTTFYVVDSYVYTWPEDKTVIQLSRRPYDDLADVVRKIRSDIYAATSHGKSSFDSGWAASSPLLATTWQHNWGARPTSFTITGAKAGGGTDQNGDPIPIPGTEVPLAFSMWDPNNGVFVGVALTASTDRAMTVAYAGLIAPCPAGGGSGWLVAGTDLIRLQIRG